MRWILYVLGGYDVFLVVGNDDAGVDCLALIITVQSVKSGTQGRPQSVSDGRILANIRREH